MRKILCVIGTRPEAIKMAPVIRALNESNWGRAIVLATAQHREMLDQMLNVFSLKADYDLNLMRPAQTQSELMGKMIPAIEQVIRSTNVDILLAQGDTTTVMCAALAAFQQRVPFGHVEAGLRTGNLEQPFPEEGYRQMISRVARWNFAPTASARKNLESEGIAGHTILVTGNTCIDALLSVRPATNGASLSNPVILLTTHRRENFGAPLQAICKAIQRILQENPTVSVVCPVHPNPEVKAIIENLLGGHSRVTLIPPQDYLSFVKLMNDSTLILTDSGGVQEEAPALGKPVLVLRETTERPEAVDEGVALLVGTSSDAIVTAASTLLQDKVAYEKMAKGTSPYGDGQAARRIVECLQAIV